MMKKSARILTIVLAISIFAYTDSYALLMKDDIADVRAVFKSGDFIEQMQALKRVRESGLALEDVQYALEPALTSKSLFVQFSALQILYTRGDTAALEILFDYLEDPGVKRAVKERVIRVIAQIDEGKPAQRLYALVDDETDPHTTLAILAVCIERLPPNAYEADIVNRLNQLMAHSNTNIRRKALRVADKGGAVYMPILARGLEDTSTAINDESFRMLVQRKNNPAVKSIFQSLAERSTLVLQLTGYYGLGMLGDKSYYNRIEQIVFNGNTEQKLSAIAFLRRKLSLEEEHYFVPVIKRIALDENVSGDVREQAERYLEWAQLLDSRRLMYSSPSRQ